MIDTQGLQDESGPSRVEESLKLVQDIVDNFFVTSYDRVGDSRVVWPILWKRYLNIILRTHSEYGLIKDEVQLLLQHLVSHLRSPESNALTRNETPKAN